MQWSKTAWRGAPLENLASDRTALSQNKIMPRKKKTISDEPISVLQESVEPEIETEPMNPPITEPPDGLAIDLESFNNL